MRVIKKFEMREFSYGCGVITQNFLLNYSLFKITVNPRKKVEFSPEKQKDMSDDGTALQWHGEKTSSLGFFFNLDAKFGDRKFTSVENTNENRMLRKSY